MGTLAINELFLTSEYCYMSGKIWKYPNTGYWAYICLETLKWPETLLVTYIKMYSLRKLNSQLFLANTNQVTKKIFEQWESSIFLIRILSERTAINWNQTEKHSLLPVKEILNGTLKKSFLLISAVSDPQMSLNLVRRANIIFWIS